MYVESCYLKQSLTPLRPYFWETRNDKLAWFTEMTRQTKWIKKRAESLLGKLRSNCEDRKAIEEYRKWKYNLGSWHKFLLYDFSQIKCAVLHLVQDQEHRNWTLKPPITTLSVSMLQWSWVHAFSPTRTLTETRTSKTQTATTVPVYAVRQRRPKSATTNGQLRTMWRCQSKYNDMLLTAAVLRGVERKRIDGPSAVALSE